MTLKTVELRSAYTFTCEECGRDTFGRLIAVEMSQEDRENLVFKYGELAEQGDWEMWPEQVKCSHCGVEFQGYPRGEGHESV